MPLGEFFLFHKAIGNVLEREKEAREEARNQ